MTNSGEADRFGADLAGFCSDIAGRYTIERELGRGGNAIVFLAQDLRHKRLVAVKILRPEIALHVTAERFLREIEIAAKLQHPNILPLFDSGTAAGHVYYVMPYVEGESLEAYLARQGPLPVDEAIRLVGEVADALSHAHSHGIVHRDVKPGNILLSGGHALVADFGVARALQAASAAVITNEGTVIGTPPYMSPEQAGASGTVDPRSDQYALGCVLYEMLAGQPPFTGPTMQAVIARHLAEPPPPLRVVRPGVTPALQAVVERALAKVPADRWSTVAEFGAHLASSSTSRSRPRSRVAASIALALVAVAAVAAWRFIFAPQTPLDPNAVVVFPLVQSPENAEPEGTGDLVDLAIGNALEHTEPLKWIDGWTRLSPEQRKDPAQLTAPLARRITRERRARWYVEGSLARHSDFVTIVLRLWDAESDSLVTRENATGHMSQAPQTAWRAVNKLLPRLLAPGRQVDLAVLMDRHPGAVATWLQGEREYRQSRFAAALELYRRAVGEDSALAPAALKGAWAAFWEHSGVDALGLVEVALAQSATLPPKYAFAARAFAHYIRGTADSAIALFQQALQLDPSWVEMWMAVGEVHYHFFTGASESDSAAQAYFDQALTLDPGFTPALFHLSQIALHRGDLERGRELVRAFKRQTPDSSWAQLDVMLRCADQGPPSIPWAELARRDPTALVMSGRYLAERGAHLTCAEQALTAVLEAKDAPPNAQWGATLGLFGVLLATGREAKVRPLLDRAAASGVAGAKLLYVIGADLAPALDEPAAATIADLAGDFSKMSPARLWYHAVWFDHQRDTAGLGRVARALQTRAIADANATMLADAITGRLAALKGATAEAISRLRRVAPRGTNQDLEWGLWQPFAAERLLHAELLLSIQEWAEAERLAASLDHPTPIMHLAYLRRSLSVRATAAEALGQHSRATAYRRRLVALGQPGLDT